MRRLSMPVGNAFSLDPSRRSATNNPAALTSQNVGVRQLGAGIVGGKGVVMDERRNLSSTTLGLGQQHQQHQEHQVQQRYQQEQDVGRPGLGLDISRRSHDASRSATNLGLGVRR